MPTLGIVDRRLGEPLGDLIRFPNMAQPRNAATGEVDAKRSAQLQGIPWGQRLWELHACNVNVLRVVRPLQCPSIRRECQRIDPPKLAAQSIEHEHVSIPKMLLGHGSLTIAVGIGPKVHPHDVQRIRALVVVGDDDVPVQDVIHIVQRHANVAVDPLLPRARWLREQRGDQRQKAQTKDGGTDEMGHGPKLASLRVRCLRGTW